MNEQVSERVNREREAHDEHDVLGENIRVKQRFPHVTTSPTMMRMEKDILACSEKLSGLRILDLGCGHGEQSLRFLQNGAAFVSGIDISMNYIDSARELITEAGFSEQHCHFCVMDAHKMDFNDHSFDMVIGRGILHHLDLEVSLAEIQRVLKVGGRAVFMEPLAANPLLKVFRYLTPKARSLDEKPLSMQDLTMINNRWHANNEYYGLISAPLAMCTSLLMPKRNNNAVLRFADWLELKLNHISALQPINQYVLLNLRRPKAGLTADENSDL
jgi:ubiquinone/menaquinone biosynthesis C-methylase UbiE